MIAVKEMMCPNTCINYIRFQFYKLRYNSIADKNKIIWVETTAVKKALQDEKVKRFGLLPIMDGDWDLKTREITSAKVLGIEEHYRQGVPWERTKLFDWYAKRFEKELLILRCKNLEELKYKYETDIEQLYQNLKTNGFLAPSEQHPDIDVIEGYIDRNGQFLYGSNGNHRLAFARILGIQKVPVKIKSRHKSWQDFREKIYKEGLSETDWDHPDLQDVLTFKG